MKTLLFIEDDSTIIQLLAMSLVNKGYTVLHAETAQEGIDLARQTPPDVIFMDMWLPNGMNGWEATTAIKNDPQLHFIPVVALTAQTSLDARQRALTAGCTSFIGKPFMLQDILDCLQMLLG